MIKTLEKTWFFISTLLVLTLSATLFFWPQSSRAISLAVLFFGGGMAIFFAVWPEIKRYNRENISGSALVRKISVKVIGLLLVMIAAILTGGWVGRLASQFAWNARWPEWAVIVAGILAGFAAGFAAGGLVRLLWGMLFKPKRIKMAQAGEG